MARSASPKVRRTPNRLARNRNAAATTTSIGSAVPFVHSKAVIVTPKPMAHPRTARRVTNSSASQVTAAPSMMVSESLLTAPPMWVSCGRPAGKNDAAAATAGVAPNNFPIRNVRNGSGASNSAEHNLRMSSAVCGVLSMTSNTRAATAMMAKYPGGC